LCKSCRTCFMFYRMFYFTGDRSFTGRVAPSKCADVVESSSRWPLVDYVAAQAVLKCCFILSLFQRLLSEVARFMVTKYVVLNVSSLSHLHPCHFLKYSIAWTDAENQLQVQPTGAVVCLRAAPRVQCSSAQCLRSCLRRHSKLLRTFCRSFVCFFLVFFSAVLSPSANVDPSEISQREAT